MEIRDCGDEPATDWKLLQCLGSVDIAPAQQERHSAGRNRQAEREAVGRGRVTRQLPGQARAAQHQQTQADPERIHSSGSQQAAERQAEDARRGEEARPCRLAARGA